MAVVSNPKEFQRYCLERKSLGKTIGFIPTMGALHKGHLELVKKSLAENDLTTVSIFVNPTQFDQESDLNSYPNLIENDLNALSEHGVDLVFTPTAPEMYFDNFNYKISESELSRNLCGAHRLGHFEGVLTVVLKLLNLAQATKAYFGEKDYQQYLLIKKMCEAFFIPTEIVPVATVREADGLALSSRNLLLGKEERNLAPKLFETISEAKTKQDAIVKLEELGFKVDYVEDVFDRRFVAARLGEVRLIDNVQL